MNDSSLNSGWKPIPAKKETVNPAANIKSGSGWESVNSDSNPKPNNTWKSSGGNRVEMDDSGGSSVTDYDIRACIPPNLGWLSKKLTPHEMKYCWECIENATEGYNDKLVGHLDNSLKLVDNNDLFFNNTLTKLIKAYTSSFNSSDLRGNKNLTRKEKRFVLNDWWVNYQKKHEYNPLHDHSGYFSFVIWMKIPTDFDEQKKLKISKQSGEYGKIGSISNFRFTYTNILGQITNYTYAQSPNQTGMMLFFPSELHHQVFPFYECDDDRISISGNIAFV
tara:strand:+ start:507 stop:1340 length:834 start_codon:yes stop_codon:yes gene_type:complete